MKRNWSIKVPCEYPETCARCSEKLRHYRKAIGAGRKVIREDKGGI